MGEKASRHDRERISEVVCGYCGAAGVPETFA